ncbi:MAG: hypothetical protein QMD92_05145 [bacterium]|nr:hypothetical protein [bacterium]
MDEKIKILVEKTGCSEQQAKQVLNSVSGNIKKAFDLINYVGKKNTIVVKGKFRGKNKNSYGLFILTLNKAKELLDHVRAVMLYDPEIYKISVRNRWDIFDRELARVNLKKKEGAESLYLHLESGLKDIFLKTITKKKLFECLKKLDLDNFKDCLISNIGNIIKDTAIDTEIEVDNISSFTSFGIRLKEGSSEEEKEKVEEGVPKEEKKEVVLKLAPVIAPVSGINVIDLKIDDQILTYIVDKTDLGLYLAELMGAKKGEKLIPVISRIYNIENLEGDKIRFTVKIGCGIFGEAIISNEVNIVKLFTEVEGEKASLTSEARELENKKMFSESLLFVLVILFLFLFFWTVLK